jgi:hypothetical protein
VAGTFQTARGRNIKTCQTRRQLSLPGGAQLDVTVATASTQKTDSNDFTGVEVLFNPLKVKEVCKTEKAAVCRSSETMRRFVNADLAPESEPESRASG